VRLGDAAGASLHGLTVRLARIRDAQRDVLHAVAVDQLELADLRPAPERAREHEADVVLLEDVARAVADAGLGARVRGAPEPERVLVVVRRLLRVPYPQLDVIPAVERHEVVCHSAILCPRPTDRHDFDAVREREEREMGAPGKLLGPCPRRPLQAGSHHVV
jgi:hypothetical protein